MLMRGNKLLELMRGNRTSFTLVTNGMLSGQRYPDGTRTTFGYDFNGSRTLMADAIGRYTYLYDALRYTISSKQPFGKSVTYNHDALSRRISLNAPDTGRSSFLYDVASQLTAVVNPFSERTTYTYDDASRKTVQRFSNGDTLFDSQVFRAWSLFLHLP